MSKKKPIREKIKGLRQRQRRDGSWRVWWEPSALERSAGFESVELDPDRPSWSIKKAKEQNDLCAKKGQGIPAQPAPKNSRCMSNLIRVYRDDHLPEKRPATQAGYHGWLNIIDEKWGHVRVGEISRGLMYEWSRTLRRTRGDTQAKRIIAIMSILMNLAERLEWRASHTNPCLELDIPIPPPRDRVVTAEELGALEEAAETLATEKNQPAYAMIGHAVRLSLFQGSRLTDVLIAKVSAFHPRIEDDGLDWVFVRSKRSNHARVPVHPENLDFVRQRIAECSDTPDAPLLPRPNGEHFDMHSFQKRFRAIRARAAKEHPSVATIQFRDFRRTASVWLRLAGGSRDDAGDLLGNSAARNDQLAATYMPPQYEGAARAVAAIQRPAQRKA